MRRRERIERLAHRRPGSRRCAAARRARPPRSRRRCAARASRSRRAASRAARGRSGTVEPSPGPTTKVPMPCRVSTSPAACSFEIASRTTVRLTPNSAMKAASVGSLVARRQAAVADAVAERVDEFVRRACAAGAGAGVGSRRHVLSRNPECSALDSQCSHLTHCCTTTDDAWQPEFPTAFRRHPFALQTPTSMLSSVSC